MTLLRRPMAPGVRDSLREFMRYAPATERIAREEAERVHRALTQHRDGAACDRAEYLSDPDTHVWLAVLNLLDLFRHDIIPDRLEMLRRVDAIMTALSGDPEHRQSDAEARAELQRRVDSLSPENKAVLQLCQRHELTPTLIAERLGVSIDVVRDLLAVTLCTLTEGRDNSSTL